MKKILLAAILIIALLASVGTASANLITNGGFETPVNTQSWQIYNAGYPGLGWDVFDQIEYQTQSTVGLIPYEGIQYAELDPNYNVKIAQTINVQSGNTYTISFAQSCRAGDPGLPSKLGVYWDTMLLGQTTCTAAQSQAWATYQYSVTPASDAAVTITFADEGRSDSYGVLLDDVKVETSTPVPEFPSVFLPVTLIIGLLGTVFLVKRTWK
jgi:hypothetical protein